MLKKLNNLGFNIIEILWQELRSRASVLIANYRLMFLKDG